MSRKKGCVWSKFYWDDYKHLIRNMDSSLLGEVLKADLNYFLTGEIADFPSEQQSLFEMIQEAIDESRENHESWCKNQKEATEAANEKRESESSQNCPTLGSFGVENKNEHELIPLESIERTNPLESKEIESTERKREGNTFLFGLDDRDAYKKASPEEFQQKQNEALNMLDRYRTSP